MSTSSGPPKTYVLEYEHDYFRMYSNTSLNTLECNHDYLNDYFNEHPVATVKVASIETPSVILFL